MSKIPLFKQLKHDQWVKPFLKQYKATLILALLLGFLTFFCAGALMFNSGFLISKSAALPSNILLVYVPIVLTRAFGIGRPVFHYLERLTSHNWVLKMTSKLRLKLYETLEKDAIFIKRDYRLGDIMGLLSEDINHIQNLYLRTIFPTFIAWLLYIFIVISVGFVSLPYALLTFCYFLLFLLAFPLWSVLVNGARQKREKMIKNELYTDLTDNVLGISDWIFSQRGQDYVALHETAEEELLKVQSKLRNFNNKRAFLVEFCFGSLAVLTIIWASFRFVGHHGGDANWIAAFVLAIFPLADAFSGLSAASQETNTYADSLERLNELPDFKNQEMTALIPDASLKLQISNLYFQFEKDGKEILKGINLDIQQGEKLAILGRSGSGKSTLATLIRGDLLPTKGQIKLGGIETKDLSDTISDYIGVIQQAPYLFNSSLLNNIRIGRSDASVEEVWEVLERVGLKKMVQQLPHGLNTMVDEAGMRFSGGERHRLALARILLKDSPIILLDEPTVGLDPVTEVELLKTFMEVLKDKTLIWITHHLKGVEYADRVIFIENGQLEMSGSPVELSETNPRYRHLKAVDDGEI
ncbi:thiol reductant ABC exporter, CydC subunit [Streptococcus urinalis FB127-CNA-2]|uniref:Thiol reductant ABC exporter, CydC subunit n=1 Tax=Streptococcus urinalis 2285-97 TaxID=764291 RepID=G5KF47_9STRE|nr:thiol reductant ABC exporter subunit CydC [Streptococcus urinalis]EHJ56851.1 thiol reductant ABC exporter, CydC subunit [Streptococcus urinalis 2285-97]EKS18158.1 thiol reductant ABC exporter, CydC subunit [Streptococcus urinalis FB127-CNA-2]VEF33017.1 competence factor transporting ATP-binding/permease protein [Streptococcus urinalis]